MTTTVSPSKTVKGPETSQAVPKRIIAKIFLLTAAILFGPIISYFLTLNTVFSGNKIYAAGFAAVLANIAVVVYLVMAFSEDSSSQETPKAKES